MANICAILKLSITLRADVDDLTILQDSHGSAPLSWLTTVGTDFLIRLRAPFREFCWFVKDVSSTLNSGRSIRRLITPIVRRVGNTNSFALFQQGIMLASTVKRQWGQRFILKSI